MARKPKKDAPIMLASVVQLRLNMAIEDLDWKLARRCLDNLERIMSGDDDALKTAHELAGSEME